MRSIIVLFAGVNAVVVVVETVEVGIGSEHWLIGGLGGPIKKSQSMSSPPSSWQLLNPWDHYCKTFKLPQENGPVNIGRTVIT